MIPAVREFEPGELRTMLAASAEALDRLLGSAGASAAEIAYRVARARERARRPLDRRLTAP